MGNRLLALAAVTLITGPSVHAAAERVGDFALLDTTGQFHQLARYQHRKALVIMSYAADCPAMPRALEELSRLAGSYKQQGIEFLLLDGRGMDRGDLPDGTSFPLLEDSTQLVSEALGMQNAGDVRVLNPQRLTLAYKGPQAPELSRSIEDMISGRSARADTVVLDSTPGCPLAFPIRDAHAAAPPDYAGDIAPLIIEKCAECHSQGGIGPFQLDSYRALLGWSPMIREVLLNRRMPPMQVDPHVGVSPTARSLTDEQRQMLVHWFDAGLPRSGDADPLALYVPAPADQWLAGEPDLILTAPANEIPATGLLDYLYADIELPFPENRWLRAVQFMPGSTGSLHHLMAFVTGPDEDFWGSEPDKTSVTRRFVAAYIPGAPRLTKYPAGTAVRVPKGHKLSLQFHYMSTGLPAVDETRVGLYFTDQPPTTELLTQAVRTDSFLLPADTPDFPVQAEHVFSENVVITGVRPRMNYRGRHMRFALELPDGTQKEFFSVPAYNYGWQPHYELQQPLAAPAGSKLLLKGAFDNSISNPANPDPGRSVSSGFGADEEIFTGYFTFYRD